MVAGRRPYLDASALVKLVLRERESDALRQYLMALPDPATSRMAFVEVHRAMGRHVAEPEMEALVAVQVGLLTVYDMCKAVDRGMVIGDVKLIEKHGGKSGSYVAGA